jgi:hypothetical protein
VKIRAVEATLAYAAITAVMTWPLAPRLASDIAGDFGDPLFNCWVMLWTSGQVLAALSGQFNAVHEYWHGNIFHPETLTITFSEHLTPQMLQILPILALTDNVVLGYNLLFLSTFVLSGLGMFLLVRDLTGRPAAAFIAGLAFAFAPYRLSQLNHLQVLSSQWMPFALLALRRYFVRQSAGDDPTGVTGSTGTGGAAPRSGRRALVGAVAAIVVQGLSCGYYLVFFPPFIAAYGLYEMAHRALLRNARVWRDLTLAALAAAVLTWPFVSPYFELRRRSALGVRSYEEAVLFSADTWSFATIATGSRLLGERVDALRKGEGDGFAGFTILLLSGAGIMWGLRRATVIAAADRTRAARQPVVVAIATLLAIDIVALLVLFALGRLPAIGGPWASSHALLAAGAVLMAALVAASPAARRFLRGAPGSMWGFVAAAVVMSALLALGPRIFAAGQPIGYGPYLWFFHVMPGANGVRVPARFFMLMTLFLAMLAGYGAAALLAGRQRLALVVVAIATAGILAESWLTSMPLNVRLPPQRGYRATPARLETGRTLDPIYRTLRDLPERAVVIEFPYADIPHDTMATYYAGYHRKRLLNGYSGFFPEVYLWRANFLSGVPFDLDAATTALRAAGVTHAIVHEDAYRGGRGHEISDWLRSIGAQQLVSHGGDRLFKVK